MADRQTVSYLPRDLTEAVDRELDNDRASDRAFRFLRLAERVFAAGYEAGHYSGYREARTEIIRTGGIDG